MKKIILPLIIVAGVIVLAGCSQTNNTTSTTGSKSKLEAGATQQEAKQETKKEEKKSNVEVVSHKTRDDGYNYGSIVGEVKNTGQFPVSFVNITVTYYDQDNEVVDTDFTYAGETSDVLLQPEKTTPFKISYQKDKVKFDHYKLDVTWNDEE